MVVATEAIIQMLTGPSTPAFLLPACSLCQIVMWVVGTYVKIHFRIYFTIRVQDADQMMFRVIQSGYKGEVRLSLRQ